MAALAFAMLALLNVGGAVAFALTGSEVSAIILGAGAGWACAFSFWFWTGAKV
jgi:uncharacterized membrane protein